MNNISVIYKKSEFELYSNSDEKKRREFIHGKSKEAKENKKSHENQKRALEKVVEHLEKAGISYDMLYRADLEEIHGKDLVVSVGGDGTFLEISHYIRDIPILGVNSDPRPNGSVGYFCCCDADGFAKALDKKERTTVNRLEILVNEKKIKEQALNDVFFGRMNPAIPTKYNMHGKRYKNGGVLACAAAGSTAWMHSENGIIMPLDAVKIQYKMLGKRLSLPKFTDRLEVESLTSTGEIFIDGGHLRYDLSLCDKLTVQQGSPLTIVGNLESKRKGSKITKFMRNMFYSGYVRCFSD